MATKNVPDDLADVREHMNQVSRDFASALRRLAELFDRFGEMAASDRPITKERLLAVAKLYEELGCSIGELDVQSDGLVNALHSYDVN